MNHDPQSRIAEIPLPPGDGLLYRIDTAPTCGECAALRARVAELERERQAYAEGFRKMGERADSQKRNARVIV